MGGKKKVSQIKYTASGVDDFQPGSRGKVLRNKLGIIRIRDMEDAELVGYQKAERTLIEEYTAQHKFTIEDIDYIHKLFLGDIYGWAGTYRDVNLSKGGFPFAAAMAVPKAMKAFERKFLARYTPCRGNNLEEVAKGIATVHVEFLLIHPYREGNGRTARLLATVMAYQAGLAGLDFGFIGGRGKEFDRYVAAIHAGLDENYGPMAAIITRAISGGLKRIR